MSIVNIAEIEQRKTKENVLLTSEILSLKECKGENEEEKSGEERRGKKEKDGRVRGSGRWEKKEKNIMTENVVEE